MMASPKVPTSTKSKVTGEALASEPKRQRLNRRDSDDQVDRIIKEKLSPLFRTEVIEGARSIDGASIRDRIRDQFKNNKAMGRKLSSKFWEGLYSDFNLNQTPADQLPNPPQGLDCRDDLLQALEAAHHDNPASRSTFPVERFLDSCTPNLNEFELHGLLHAVQENTTLCRPSALKLQLAVLRYFARTDAQKDFPKHWGIMKDQMDSCITRNFEKMRSNGIAVLHFYRRFRKELALFMPASDVEVVMDSMVKNEDPPNASLRRCLSSSDIGATMLSQAALKMNYSVYIQGISESLQDLESNRFIPEEVNNFKTVMMKRAKELQECGAMSYAKGLASIVFCSAKVCIPVQCPDDEWYYRLWAKVKSAGINNGCLKMAPWEELLFSVGGIPAVPETIKVNEELLSDALNARDACMGLLGPQKLTLAEMKKVVGCHLKSLLALDRSFALEAAFLSDVVQEKLHERVQQQVLAELPAEGRKATMPQVLCALEKIRRGNLVITGGSSMDGELNGIASIVRSLSDGVGPSDRDAKNYSAFFKLCLKHMENFLCVDATDQLIATGGKLKLPKQVQLFGQKAMEYEIEHYTQSLQSGEKKTLKDVQVFRTFTWMLTAEQKELTSGWLQDILKNHMVSHKEILNGAAADDHDGDTPSGGAGAIVAKESGGGAIVAVASRMLKSGVSTGSSSSSSSSMTTTKVNVAKFFGPKK